MIPWLSRLAALGASAHEQAAIARSYYAAPGNVQAALDTLIGGIAGGDLLVMLNTWRSSGSPFADGYPGGGLPFGTGVATLTGDPADDAYAITAGTGLKVAASPSLLSSYSVNPVTAPAYQLALPDAAKLLTLTNAVQVALTVPAHSTVAFGVGAWCDLFTVSAAGAQLALAAGVSLQSAGTTLGQGVGVRLVQLAIDSWALLWLTASPPTPITPPVVS
jgi:hypothetical protein